MKMPAVATKRRGEELVNDRHKIESRRDDYQFSPRTLVMGLARTVDKSRRDD